MAIGFLGFKRPELEKYIGGHSYQTNLYLQYSDILKTTQIGRNTLDKIHADDRVKELSNKMVRNGNIGSLFDIERLAMWFLWYANEHNESVAQKILDTFLDSNTTSCLNTLWLQGVNVRERLDLENGYFILPIEQMPDSSDKEAFMQHRISVHGFAPSPATAIVRRCETERASEQNAPPKIDPKSDFNIASKNLSDLSILINCLENVSCVPNFSTSYAVDTPLGPFASAGGGQPWFDVACTRFTTLEKEQIPLLKKIFHQYLQKSEKEKHRIMLILGRLSQAKRRLQTEDKILDLGIVLEMLLLNDNQANTQLSLSFRLRGSWLLGKDGTDRKELYKSLKEIYTHRSEVAHSGMLCGGDPRKIELVRNKMSSYELIAERVVQTIVINGQPDWDNLVLDIEEANT